MDSLYFRDTMGMLVEMASYRFESPEGLRYADVLIEAHCVRVAQGDPAITRAHVADALENLVGRRDSL